MSFDDHESAAKMMRVLKRIARDEVAKSRPGASYATVTSIDRATRTCTVLFPGGVDGEDNVRIPYTDEPSQVGQVVRVGGTPNDRYIEAVRGTSSLEQRIIDLEAGLAALDTRTTPVIAAYKLAFDYPLELIDVKPIPFNTPVSEIVGDAPVADSSGVLSISVSGVYNIGMTIMYEPISASLDIWPRVKRVNGTEYDTAWLREDQQDVNTSIQYIDQIPLMAGEKFWINHLSGDYGECWDTGTRLTLTLVSRLYPE